MLEATLKDFRKFSRIDNARKVQSKQIRTTSERLNSFRIAFLDKMLATMTLPMMPGTEMVVSITPSMRVRKLSTWSSSWENCGQSKFLVPELNEVFVIASFRRLAVSRQMQTESEN